jgi:ABC-type cobalamin/Fe3+-siderophores transport system ATPase subunit
MTLSAHALDYGFATRSVGHGIELSLAAGEIVCLLGANGSGKTTLLRTLLGVLAPLAGRVMLEDRELSRWPYRARAARIAYVPQAAEGDFDFTVAEVVEMGRSARRGLFEAPRAGDRAAAHAALERLGIAHLAERPIHRVSGGERQLALIARALATEATFLLMDEPTANLDFGNQSLILAEVARLRAHGAGVLFSTHHPDHALRIADSVVLLKAGAIMAAGPTATTATSQSLTALYGQRVDVVTVEAPGGPRAVCIGNPGK